MTSDKLVLHQAYSREQIHGLFEPGTPFTPQTGRWGLPGIVRLDGRAGDYGLMVIFGRRQGEHTFDEGISTEDILRWQSQPQQVFADRTIRELIAHDEDRNSVYLFLRTAPRVGGVRSAYTYLGHLKYVGHDADRERPVHFAWQLLRWPIPPEVLARMRLTLEVEPDVHVDPAAASRDDVAEVERFGRLVEEPPPLQRAERGENTRTFRASKRQRRAEHENQALGIAGELLVLERERQQLVAAGRPDLAERVVHTAVVEGDGAGFDVASFFPDGRRKYVEVKTTTGPKEADFFISANEVAFAASHADSYELCRVFDYDHASNSGRFYSVPGAGFQDLYLTPTHFRVGQLTSA